MHKITKLRESLTPELVSAIEAVVTYNWYAEQEDFEERCFSDDPDDEPEQDPETHIFSSLKALREWIG